MPKFPIKVVMVSGHFDPFHDGHLDYFKQRMVEWEALRWLICVVSSDAQLMRKKGRVNIPEAGRREIVDLILKGLDVLHETVLNEWDTKTTLIAEALRRIKPDVLFRGGDKTIEDMPPEERQVCEELGIKIVHAKLEVDRHGSRMEL